MISEKMLEFLCIHALLSENQLILNRNISDKLYIRYKELAEEFIESM